MQIEPPASFKTLEEILPDVLGGFTGLPAEKDQLAPFESGLLEPEKDSDGDELTDEEERMWNTDPNNPDTDGDGYNDFQEIIGGYNPNGPGKLFE